MDHAGALEFLVQSYAPHRYLECGVATGYSFLRVRALVPECVGVDRASRGVPGVLTMTTAAFFQTNPAPFDLIFIDADHAYASVVADLDGALGCLAPGGLVALHDTDPAGPTWLHPGYCHDAYRVVTEYLPTRADLTFFTLPLDVAGLTIVQRRADTRAARWMAAAQR